MQLVLSGQKEHVLSAWIETVSAQRRKSETPQVSWKPLPLSVSTGMGGSLNMIPVFDDAIVFGDRIYSGQRFIFLRCLL